MRGPVLEMGYIQGPQKLNDGSEKMAHHNDISGLAVVGNFRWIPSFGLMPDKSINTGF
jgi:hypothetical protein